MVSKYVSLVGKGRRTKYHAKERGSPARIHVAEAQGDSLQCPLQTVPLMALYPNPSLSDFMSRLQ